MQTINYSVELNRTQRDYLRRKLMQRLTDISKEIVVKKQDINHDYNDLVKLHEEHVIVHDIIMNILSP